MKLWIFRPHKDWTYCGGARIAIAETLERAGTVLCETANAEYPTFDPDDSIFQATDSDRLSKYEDGFINGVDIWVLVEAIDVSETQERVVLDDWNYA